MESKESGSSLIAQQDTTEENIRVVCRFRPINTKERHEEKTQRLSGRPIEVDPFNNATVVIPRSDGGHKPLQFTLDRILNSSTTQDDAFKILAQPIVEQVKTGYNCTIFAYGQTGSGMLATYCINIFIFVCVF